jgi:hypothetical protein
MWKSIGMGLALVLTGPFESGAQTYVDVGASVAQVCITGEASCADQVVARGWQAGVWFNEKMAVRFRHLDASRPDLHFTQEGHGVRWTSRGRSLWLGEVTWHFGAPAVARLFVGASAGVQRDRLTVQCDPVCDPVRASGRRLGILDGPNRLSLGGLAGVSIHPARRILVMAGVICQNFPAEHWGVIGPILQVSYRHPIGR